LFQIVPSRLHLEAIGHQLGKVLNYTDLIQDTEIHQAVLKELASHGLKRGLEKFEIPAALTLIAEPWTPESGVITAAFKLKRKVIQSLYQKDIDRMYA
jgi:long-chain acyl-CoA synthetase